MVDQSDDVSAALRDVATMFADLGDHLHTARSTPGRRSAFEAVTAVALRRIDGADTVSLTTFHDGRFTTAAATDERAARADEIQYQLGSGPCVDTIVHDTLHHIDDLRTDTRWPEYGRRAHTELDLTAMLSYRLGIDEVIGDVIAGLNVYAARPDAFSDTTAEVGLLLATHASMAVAAHISSDKAGNLEKALESNRDIGVAMGMLMAQHKLTRTHAFDLLRITSQHTNRKIHDIAGEVGDTGVLPYPAGRRQPPRET